MVSAMDTGQDQTQSFSVGIIAILRHITHSVSFYAIKGQTPGNRYFITDQGISAEGSQVRLEFCNMQAKQLY